MKTTHKAVVIGPDASKQEFSPALEPHNIQTHNFAKTAKLAMRDGGVSIAVSMTATPNAICAAIVYLKGLLPPIDRPPTDTTESYWDLILQVESAFPDESRHETAKRYIRERETGEYFAAQEAPPFEVILPAEYRKPASQ